MSVTLFSEHFIAHYMEDNLETRGKNSQYEGKVSWSRWTSEMELVERGENERVQRELKAWSRAVDNKSKVVKIRLE